MRGSTKGVMIIPGNIMSDDFRSVYQHGSGRAVPSPSAPLDDGQKAHLCILAREAFEEVHGRPPANQAEMQDWRREQQENACGVSSLRTALQSDYKPIERRFLQLKGNARAAERAAERAATEPIRLALFKLRESLKERGLHESYAAAICRKQFKCGLNEATERQIWCLNYTVRNRRKAASKPVAAVCDRREDDDGQRPENAATEELEPDWITVHAATETEIEPF